MKNILSLKRALSSVVLLSVILVLLPSFARAQALFQIKSVIAAANSVFIGQNISLTAEILSANSVNNQSVMFVLVNSAGRAVEQKSVAVPHFAEGEVANVAINFPVSASVPPGNYTMTVVITNAAQNVGYAWVAHVAPFAVTAAPPDLLLPVVAPAGPIVDVSLAGGGKNYTSINAALSAVANSGGTVVLHDAVYSGPLTISGMKSPVLIKSASGVPSQLNCGVKLNSWQHLSGSIYTAKTAGKVSEVSLNSSFMPRARYPASGYLATASVGSSAPYLSIPMRSADVLALQGKDVSNATVYFRNTDYVMAASVVKSIDAATGTLIDNSAPLQPSECSNTGCSFSYQVQPGWGYFLTNKLWMMSQGAGQPGTWVFDAPLASADR